MNVLDENVPEDQRTALQEARIRVRQIGREVGGPGTDDEGIIPILDGLRSVTFFTRDDDFYDRRLCHPGYCLVCLVVSQHEVAEFVRRVLKHPALNASAKRMGKVIRATHSGLRVWELRRDRERQLAWA